ncbi:glycosyltransferase family 9 protein [Edaphobacter dinghuensis]|uniref:glycosyltransferase family 9 protein n=1 Tax=Edaphobacter dinghuensis TaxID=1560005 RepID=UPI001E5A42A5|nr:glycosyltransferase family 9 protein [Edaphobacter dinghuensis]
MMQRVLIIKFGAIGDVVMAVPAAYALHLGGAEIDWVCGPAVVPLLQCYPWIRTIPVDDQAMFSGTITEKLIALAALWRAIGWKKYDLCATLYYDARYRVVMLPVHARRKIMLSRKNRTWMLLAGRHHTDEYARILLRLEDGERPLGLAPVRPENLPESPLIRVDTRSRVVLVPAGAKNMIRDDALRRWPVENYVALASALIERGVEVILAGGPGDRWAIPFFEGMAVTNLIGNLELPEMLALLDDSDVIVTHDTGPLHLAGVTKVGIVSIFGPTDPRGRLPQRTNTVALWGGEGFACRPCYDGRDFAPCLHNGCMRQVSVEMVLREVYAVLEQRQSGRSMPPRIITPVSTVVAEL